MTHKTPRHLNSLSDIRHALSSFIQ